MVSLILSLAASALSIWESKLKQKYIDRMVELETEYYKAVNASDADIDAALIDRIEFDIFTLVKALTVDMKK